MKTLFLIRGLPGSGKSTFALQFCAPVCEADMFFTSHDGTYEYDASRISEAHKFCQNSVEHLMSYKEPRIVVANTFTQRWEMEVYQLLALKHGYRVVEVTMSGPLFQNVHGVPEDKIQAMRDRWEK